MSAAGCVLLAAIDAQPPNIGFAEVCVTEISFDVVELFVCLDDVVELGAEGLELRFSCFFEPPVDFFWDGFCWFVIIEVVAIFVIYKSNRFMKLY